MVDFSPRLGIFGCVVFFFFLRWVSDGCRGVCHVRCFLFVLDGSFSEEIRMRKRFLDGMFE